MEIVESERFPCRHPERYDALCYPCKDLLSHGVPAVVWFEHAVCRYGAPCVPFTLFILVNDLDVAAAALKQLGWDLREEQCKIMNLIVDVDHRVLTLPRNTNLTAKRPRVKIDLLRARDWHYTLHSDVTSIYPTLPDLVDALVSKIFEPHVEIEVLRRVLLYLLYLFDHAPNAGSPAFAEGLRYENRQFYYDYISGVEPYKEIYLQHARRYRDGLLHGTEILRPCSVVEDKYFFKPFTFIDPESDGRYGYETYDQAKQRLIEEEAREWEEMCNAEVGVA